MRRSILKRDPNFLPLLDVIFILLFFFMFSLVISSDFGKVDVNLPKSEAEHPARKGEKLVITLDRYGRVGFKNRTFQNIDELKSALSEMSDREILLAADGEQPYAQVMALISTLKEAGMDRVGLLFEMDEHQK